MELEEKLIICNAIPTFWTLFQGGWTLDMRGGFLSDLSWREASVRGPGMVLKHSRHRDNVYKLKPKEFIKVLKLLSEF